MKLSRFIAPLLAATTLVACGGVRIVFKSPIEDQCNKAGLVGCPDIVEGTLVYIEGDKVHGKEVLVGGVKTNVAAPEKVKIFANAIRTLPLDKLPGGIGPKYGTVIIEIADIIAGAIPTEVVVAPPPTPVVVAPPPQLTGLNLEGAQLAGIPDIEFDTGQATIKASPKNETTLNLLLVGGKTNPSITLLRVEGHTDSDGDPASNQVLSERRAQAVVAWLVGHGIAANRLRAVGCAAKDPLFPNDSAEHKARNRRTEFDIETINGQKPNGYTDACAPNTFRK